MLAALVWIKLFGLQMEFWDPEILEGIGNAIGSFVKVAESTKRGRYTSYARVCVYMNITEPLPEFIELEYHDEVWQQPVDYEHIPFWCRRCHEYGHVYRQCPLNRTEESTDTKEEERTPIEDSRRDEEGFKEVKNKRKSGKRNKRRDTRQGEVEEKGEQTNEKTQIEIDPHKDKGGEEERIMRKLLQEWRFLDERFILEEQKQIYKEAFQKYKEKAGVSPANKLEQTELQGAQNSGMGSSGKGGRKRGKRSMSKTIQEVGEMLVNLGRVIPL
eukprot:PITA_12662